MQTPIPYGPYGYAAHLDDLGQQLRWARQCYRDAQASGDAARIRAWAARVDQAQAEYDRAAREQ